MRVCYIVISGNSNVSQAFYVTVACGQVFFLWHGYAHYVKLQELSSCMAPTHVMFMNRMRNLTNLSPALATTVAVLACLIPYMPIPV